MDSRFSAKSYGEEYGVGTGGFTGIDLSKARNDMDIFYEQAGEACDSFRNCFHYLFNELYYIWCSPNAVEFSKKYNVQVGDFFLDVVTKFEKLYENLQNAYNAVAQVNGADIIQVDNNLSIESLTITRGVESFKSLVSSHPINGTIGMNIALVKLVLSQFEPKAQQVLANFESIPTNVAIYDPEGLQAQTIAASINETKNDIGSMLSSIINDIKTYIETEKNSIMLAKQQVVQNMNGGSGTTNA